MPPHFVYLETAEVYELTGNQPIFIVSNCELQAASCQLECVHILFQVIQHSQVCGQKPTRENELDTSGEKPSVLAWSMGHGVKDSRQGAAGRNRSDFIVASASKKILEKSFQMLL
jgi:hypothetical protein